MGNTAFLIPQTNLQDFELIKICTLIRNKFESEKLNVELLDIGQIVIKEDNGDHVFKMWMEDGKDPAYKDLLFLIFKKLNLTKEYCLGMGVYGRKEASWKRSNQITKFLLDHFKGYQLDEGIHPEFIKYDDEYFEKYKI